MALEDTYYHLKGQNDNKELYIRSFNHRVTFAKSKEVKNEEK